MGDVGDVFSFGELNRRFCLITSVLNVVIKLLPEFFFFPFVFFMMAHSGACKQNTINWTNYCASAPCSHCGAGNENEKTLYTDCNDPGSMYNEGCRG